MRSPENPKCVCSPGNGDKNKKVKKADLQTITVSVVDEDNEAIAGAEVNIYGMVGYTDMDGNYTFSTSSLSNDEIKVSFISFEDETVKVSDLKDGKITLREE